VLILGGGGFLGSALLQGLARKFTCICFGNDTNFNRLRQRVPATVEFVAGDVGDEDLVASVMREVEAVIYLAGTGGEASCLANPVRSVATHVAATHLVLQLASRQRIKRFIFASTIAVYGTYQPRPMPLAEDMELRPDDFYGILKATAEREIVDSGQYQIFRLTNVYGATDTHSLSACGVIGKFVEAARNNEDLQIYGDGSQEIDYVHIDDVCRAFEMALEQPPRNFIYNVGGERPVSILTIANLIKDIAREQLGHEPNLRFVAAEHHKVWPSRWLSIAKIEREMQWQPKISLRDGLKSTLVN
jgi:UDP-glucose 4-epimerase